MTFNFPGRVQNTVRRIPVIVVSAVTLIFQCATAEDAPRAIEPPLLAEQTPIAAESTAAEFSVVEPDLPVADPGPAVQLAPAANHAEAVSETVRRFHYLLRLSVRGLYDDNINVSHSNRISDFVTTIEPSVMLGFGDTTAREENYLRFDYAPSIFLYAEHTEANAVQQLVHLEGQYQFSRLTLNLRQDVQILDGTSIDAISDSGPLNDRVNLDVSGRARVNIFTTRLNASYYLGAKTFLSSQVGATIYDYPSLISSETFFGNLFLNYAYSPKFTIGVGGGAGYNLVDDPSPDETFEQISGRITYHATGKLSFNGSFGVEFREFDQVSRDTYVSPVFEAGLTYQPFDGTSLKLDATRHTSSSAVLAGQDYSSTNFVVGARQRFLQRFSFGVTAGYENSDYFSVVDGVEAARKDDYYFIEPVIDVTITRFWSVGAYYLRRHNSSSTESFSFYDNQVGFRTSLTF